MIAILAALLAAVVAEENPAAPGLEPSHVLVQRLAAAFAANNRNVPQRGVDELGTADVAYARLTLDGAAAAELEHGKTPDEPHAAAL